MTSEVSLNDNSHPEMGDSREGCLGVREEAFINEVSAIGSKRPTPTYNDLYDLERSKVYDSIIILAKICQKHDYQYKKKAFISDLQLGLPVIFKSINGLLDHDLVSEQSCMIQEQVLKTFNTIVEKSVPKEVFTNETIDQLVTLAFRIAEQDIPESALSDTEPKDAAHIIWWRCQEWSLKILFNGKLNEQLAEKAATDMELMSRYRWHVMKICKITRIITKIHDRCLQDIYVSPSVKSLTSKNAFAPLFSVPNKDVSAWFVFRIIDKPMYHYVTLGLKTFASSKTSVMEVADKCFFVLNQSVSFDHLWEASLNSAAKLLEVILLEFVQIDIHHPDMQKTEYMIEFCMSSVANAMLKLYQHNAISSKIQLLNIVTLLFYYDCDSFFVTLKVLEQRQNLNPPGYTCFNMFVKLLFDNIDQLSGIHDRKVSMMGLIRLITLPLVFRPPIFGEISCKILPSILTLCERLKIAYEMKATGPLTGGDKPTTCAAYDDCRPTYLEAIFETRIDRARNLGGEDEFCLLNQAIEFAENNPDWYQELLTPLIPNKRKCLKYFRRYTRPGY